MENRDKEEFLSTISALAATFRVEPSEPLIEGYWMALDDLPIATVVRAVRSAMRGCERMPTGAELRKLSGEMADSGRAIHAWDAVIKAIGRHGAYASVDFDDPVINATIRNLGGWQKVCQTDTEELLKWTRKDFERVYASLCVTGVSDEATRYLVGVHEQANGAAGHQISPPTVVVSGLPPHRDGVVRRLSAPERLAMTGGQGGQRAFSVGELVASVATARDARRAG